MNTLTTLIDQLDAKQIEYKSEWSNGTGYFDHATDETFEHPVWSTTPDGRVIVIIPVIPEENVVVFQRYTDAPEIIAFNLPSMRRTQTGRLLNSCFPYALRLNASFGITEMLKAINDARCNFTV